MGSTTNRVTSRRNKVFCDARRDKRHDRHSLSRVVISIGLIAKSFEIVSCLTRVIDPISMIAMEEAITELATELDALPEVIAERSDEAGADDHSNRRADRRVWCEAGYFPAPRCHRIEPGVSLWPRPMPSSEVNAEPIDVSAIGIRVRTRAKNVKSPLLCEGDRIRLEFDQGKWNEEMITLECVVRYVSNDPIDDQAAIVGLEMINALLNPQRRKMWSGYRLMISKIERDKLRRMRQG